MADHQFKLVTQSGNNTANASADNLLSDLRAGLGGGVLVSDFFSGDIEALHSLYETIATGDDSIWLDGIDKNGNPMTYVANGNHYLSVFADIHDRQTVRDGTGSDTDFKQVGTATVALTTDQGTSIVMLNAIHYTGIGIAGLGLTGPAIKVLKPLLRIAGKFIKNVAVRIFNYVKGGGAAADAGEAEDTVSKEAEASAEEVGEAGADVGEGIFADVSFTVLDGVGAVVAVGAIAVVLILELLEKQITSYVKFFNATSIDVQFGICFVTDKTGAKVGPPKIGDTVLNKKIGKAPTPPGVISNDMVIYRTDLQFINDNELYGIGYVLNALPSGDFPGFKIMVSIPAEEDNLFYMAFNNNNDCASIWNDHDNDYPDKGVSNDILTGDITSGKYRLRIATNANRGKTPSPINKEEGYNYEHLIVLTDGTVNI